MVMMTNILVQFFQCLAQNNQINRWIISFHFAFQLRVKGLTVTYNQSSIQLPPEAFRSSRDSRVITLVYLTLNDVLSLGKESKDDDDEDEDALSANTTIVSSTIDPRPPAVLNKPVKIVLQNRRVLKLNLIFINRVFVLIFLLVLSKGHETYR